VNGERVSLDASVAATVAGGDVFAARARAIDRRHHPPPWPRRATPEPDDTDTPIELNPPMVVDVRADEIASPVGGGSARARLVRYGARGPVK
jgi:hypothetical protein